ncbi:MAG: alpha/beta hydrolase [Rikenellaceae bacterium]
MNKLNFPLLIIAFLAFTRAATAQEIKLYPDGYIPVDNSPMKKDSLVVFTDAQFFLVREVREPSIEIFKAKGVRKNKTIVVAPGGGYYVLSIENEGSRVCELLNNNGYDAALLRYRVPTPKGDNRHVRSYQDIQRALSLVRAKGSEYGISSEQVGVIGFSAGGFISALSSCSDRSYEVIDEIDGFSCKPDFCALIYPGGLEGENFGVEKNIKINSSIPQTFISVAEDDNCVYGAMYYYHALAKAKVSATLHIFSDGGHGFGVRNTGSAREWKERYIDWLDKLEL